MLLSARLTPAITCAHRAAGVIPLDRKQRSVKFPLTVDEFWPLYTGLKEILPRGLQGQLTGIVENSFYIRHHHLFSPSLLSSSCRCRGTRHHPSLAYRTARLPRDQSQRFPLQDCSSSSLQPSPRRSPPITLHGLLRPSHTCSLPRLHSHTRRTGVLSRHNPILDTILAFARRVGLRGRVEPAIRDAKGKRTVPDAVFAAHLGNGSYRCLCLLQLCCLQHRCSRPNRCP